MPTTFERVADDRAAGAFVAGEATASPPVVSADDPISRLEYSLAELERLADLLAVVLGNDISIARDLSDCNNAIQARSLAAIHGVHACAQTYSQNRPSWSYEM